MGALNIKAELAIDFDFFGLNEGAYFCYCCEIRL